jgi:hypothetical protein
VLAAEPPHVNAASRLQAEPVPTFVGVVRQAPLAFGRLGLPQKLASKARGLVDAADVLNSHQMSELTRFNPGVTRRQETD